MDYTGLCWINHVIFINGNNGGREGALPLQGGGVGGGGNSCYM